MRGAGLFVAVVWLVGASGCGGTAETAAVGGEDVPVVGVDSAVDVGLPPLPCGSGCPVELHCDEATRTCVACLEDTHCDAGEVCDVGRCRVRVCEPGTARCEDGVEQRCNSLGTAREAVPCGEDAVCVNDGCKPLLCTPGVKRCQSGFLMTCVEPGVSESMERCVEGELCVPGVGCSPLYHNIVTVVDTSGSMNKEPGPSDFFVWTDPWPTCESFEEPSTRIGISRKLFRRLLAEETEAFRKSDFVLMRFPQRASGRAVRDLAEPARTACDDGLWEENAEVTLDGDDGVHATEGPDDWFRRSIWEAVLVPDPRTSGFASLVWDARKDAIATWLDGQEEAVPATPAVPCTRATALEDCGPERPCLGPTGAMVCHDVTNPELRAVGSTPLGRSLFYASEYLRRFVYVDGRSCTEDADCESANYGCRDGACYDPLRDCREAVIVLFTDGTEAPVPSDPFFTGRVQAKRLHYGLGCTDDADCLSEATCGPEGTCATEALRAGAASDETLAAVLAYQDAAGADRVLDGRGKPIRMTVHVIDVASGESDAVDNARLATLGGGLIIRRSLTELDALLEDLRRVFDVKAGAQCLSEGD